MFTVIIFLAVISVLVLVHEAGHFFAAKRAGMKVEEFGFGFPPRLWGFTRGGTTYSINLIPFGGFVRIFGENGDDNHRQGSFMAGTFWQKVRVICAGVAMNLIFASLLLMAVNFFGLRVGLFDEAMVSRATAPQIQILQVMPESPAERGGLRQLDQILGFREEGVLRGTSTPEEVQSYAFAHQGSEVRMVVRRSGTLVDIPLTLRIAQGPGEGPIGISLLLTGVVRYSWYESIWRGITDTLHLFWAILVGFSALIASLFTTGRLGADISGPVGIATLTGQAAHIGINYLLQFVAMISVNLAVLNILPFPALDGGRLVLVFAERIRGKALSQQVERTINAAGFIVLIVLMVAVTVRDIVKFF